METKKSDREEFYGTYKDIKFEIIKFPNPMKKIEDQVFDSSRESEFNWCHYIYLDLDKQIEDKEIADKLWLEPKYTNKGRFSYDYWTEEINNIEFHGGCTFYSKVSSPDDKNRRIKIGCDYQHIGDVGREYNLSFIEHNVQKTIDSFIENVTPVMKRCSGCGIYYKEVDRDGCGKCEYSKEKY